MSRFFTWTTFLILLIILLVVVGGSVYWVDARPKVSATATAHYIGRESCAQCHQTQHEDFLGSHHHHALARVGEDTVLADFSDQTLEHDGVTSRFYRDGNRYLVDTEGPTGDQATFEILYVLAYKPLQQYMVRLVDSTASVDLEQLEKSGLPALQVLRLCWDVEGKRWFYLRPEDVPEKLEPGDPLHWTGVTQRWNTSCAACHSTNLEKNFDGHSDSFATTFSQIDVGCESCHGPGSLHVEIAQNRWLQWDPVHGKGLFSLKSATAKQQIDTCAGCHSRRRLLTEDFHDSRQVHDHLIYEPMRRETYFVDGQIKDEDYVYGSFLQSKMHMKGIRCTDCHNPHTGKTHYPGNQLCTSCHQHPAGVYDSTQHHGHQAGSEGSQCVNCHMPHRYYMEVDPRRDHSIRVPRPDLSVRLGVPNACTGCHLEQKNVDPERHSQLVHYQDWQRLAEAGHQDVIDEMNRVDQWAMDIVAGWRKARGKPIEEPHFGELLAVVRDLDPEDRSEQAGAARKALLRIATDPTRSPMYRVTAAAESAGWRDAASLEKAMELLDDEDAEVVFFALQRLQSELGRQMEYVSYGASQQSAGTQINGILREVVKLLEHPRRLVRIQAASTLAAIPESMRMETLGAKLRQFETAFSELIQVHLLNEELAAIGDLYQGMGRWDRAKDYYRQAIQHSGYEYGARTNLAVLLEEEIQAEIRDLQSGLAGGAARSAAQLRERMTEIRQQADSTAKQIAELRNEDFEILKKEVERSGHLPTAGDLHYRYGMAEYLRGNREETREHLEIAVDRNPNVETYLLGLATFYQADQAWDKALLLARRLVSIDPQHPGYQSLLENIQNQIDPTSNDPPKSGTGQ